MQSVSTSWSKHLSLRFPRLYRRGNLWLNAFMGRVSRLNVFRREGLVRGFAERLFQGCRERVALRAVGVEDVDRDLTGPADSDFELRHEAPCGAKRSSMDPSARWVCSMT